MAGMPRSSCFFAAALIALALCPAVSSAQAPAPRADDELSRFAAWFGGEFNNHEQVWQQRIDLADAKVTTKPVPAAHLHQIVAPFSARALEGGVASYYYLQQQRGGERTASSVATLQRVLRLSSVAEGLRMELFRLADERAWLDAHRQAGRLDTLTANDLRPLPACELRWRWDGTARRFTATAATAPIPTDCGLPAGSEPITLAEQQLATGDGGRYRKLRYFSGWVWMKNAGPTAAADDRKASFARNVQLHTEGQRAPVMLEDGRDSGYELELALLTYQNTRHPILKFTLIDKASGKSHAYTWANTDATLIGINLGWMQAGFTQKGDRVAYGW